MLFLPEISVVRTKNKVLMRVLKLYSIFLIFIVLPFFSLAIQPQNSGVEYIDSLLQQVDQKTGTDRINSQLDLAIELLGKQNKVAQTLADSALVSAKMRKNKNLEMRSYLMLGIIHTELLNYSHSLIKLENALQLAEAEKDNWYLSEILFRMGVNKHRMGEFVPALESFTSSIQFGLLAENHRFTAASYSQMGTIFRMIGLYDRAIEYIIKSKLYYEKIDFTEGSGWAAYLLGRIYVDLKLPEKALENFNESLEIYTKQATVDGNKNGLAICYEQIAVLNIEAENFEEAGKNISRAEEIYNAENSKYGMSNVYKNLGIIEYLKGNYMQAENYLGKALEMKKEVQDILSMPQIYAYLGLSVIEQDQVQKGLETIQKGLELAIANDQKKIQLDIYAKLTSTYLALNQYQKAIESQNQQIEIQNLILAGGVNIKTEQLQAIVEIDRQNQQIEALQKENELNALNIKQQRIIRNIMIFIIVLALFTTTIIFLLNRQIKDKNRKLRESNAAKDKFFAIIAHDLRGPTKTLASLLELLISRFDDFSLSELKEMLLKLFKSAENVSKLLENLLIWARSQVAKIEYRPQQVNLNEALENVIKGQQQFAESKNIKIYFEQDEPKKV